MASMSISRDAVGVCLLGDKLYAVGGYDGQTYLNTVEAYDPQTNEWTQVWHFFFHYYTHFVFVETILSVKEILSIMSNIRIYSVSIRKSSLN